MNPSAEFPARCLMCGEGHAVYRYTVSTPLDNNAEQSHHIGFACVPMQHRFKRSGSETWKPIREHR